MFTRRSALTAAVAGASIAPSLVRAQGAAPKPPSIEELLRTPVVVDAAISPNGEQLVVLRDQGVGGKDKALLTFIKLAHPDAQPTFASLDFKVEYVEWANDERLLVWLVFHSPPGSKEFYGLPYDGAFVRIPVRRVLSVDLAGQNAVFLFSDARSILKRTFDAATIVDYLKDDPQHVLMQAWNAAKNGYALYKVDVYTGAATLVEQGPPSTDLWLTQNGVPILRMDSNSRGTTGSVYGRAPGETGWKLIRKSRFNELRKLPDFDVVGMTSKAGVLLVSQVAEGQDAAVIRTFDVATLQFGQTVAEVANRSLTSAFVDENLYLVATSYWDDRLNYVFADQTLDPHFRGINTALGKSCNLILYDIDLAHDRILIRASGPQEPGSFHVYDRNTRNLELVGLQRPWLTAERLAKMEALRVQTRDGAEITAYLTSPINAGARPCPLVVMPHGGPEVRDTQDYDIFVQALAARGWMVLQPNFRGSGGYGKAFAKQGHRQWGGRMQDDVEDAVSHVVATGRVDPRKIAICGTSYGGYAALMGAVRKPSLYKAVVSIAGDTELIQTLAFSRREDGEDSPTYAYWRTSIGDPKTDEALLIASSPARRAAEILAPVLLIHGQEDKVVDPKQSKIMAKSLLAAGRPCELLEIKGEGHRNWSNDTWNLVLTRSTEFIAKYI